MRADFFVAPQPCFPGLGAKLLIQPRNSAWAVGRESFPPGCRQRRADSLVAKPPACGQRASPHTPATGVPLTCRGALPTYALCLRRSRFFVAVVAGLQSGMPCFLYAVAASIIQTICFYWFIFSLPVPNRPSVHPQLSLYRGAQTGRGWRCHGAPAMVPP